MGVYFNYHLYNLYRDDDSIGWHKDNSSGFVDQAPIYIVATYTNPEDNYSRDLVLRPNDTNIEWGIPLEEARGVVLLYPTNEEGQHSYHHDHDPK